MEDRRLEEYKEVFDNIHAPEHLKNNILKMKPQKRNYRPVIAFASTVAAAIAIFASVGNYDFTNKDDSGVIKQVAVIDDTTQTNAPSYTKGNTTMEPEGAVTERPEITPAAKPMPDNMVSATKKPLTPAVVKNPAAPLKSNKATQNKINTTDEVNSAPTLIPTSSPQITEKQAEQAEGKQISVPQTDTINEPQSASEDNSATQTTVGRSSGGGGGALSDVKTEEWDNNRYFNYIGIDIVSEIEQNSSFVYIGASSNFVTVTEDGEIINDEWNFVFERPDGGYINIITSKKGSDNSGLSDAVTEGAIKAAISENGDSYSCHLRNKGTSYMVYATKITKEEFISLLKSLIL
jgi:hypothetical protein